MARPWRGVSRGMWWHRWSGPERGEVDFEAGTAARHVDNPDLPLMSGHDASTIANPSPAPEPGWARASWRVRNRSKMRSRSPGAMPGPSSSTISSTVSPELMDRKRHRRRCVPRHVGGAVLDEAIKVGVAPGDLPTQKRDVHPGVQRRAELAGLAQDEFVQIDGHGRYRLRGVRAAPAPGADRRAPGADRVGPGRLARVSTTEGRLGRFGFEQDQRIAAIGVRRSWLASATKRCYAFDRDLRGGQASR